MADAAKEIAKLNKTLKMEQEKGSVANERIEDWDAIESLLILNVLDYSTREALLLGFAALNLVNAFANQCRKENKEHPKLNFHFRIHLRRLMRAYVKLDGSHQDGSMKFHYKNEMVLVSIYGFQFSFQHERHSVLFDVCDTKDLVFDGVKKQPKAKRILDTILECCGYVLFTERGESLSSFLEKEKQHPENYRFSKGNCYKINSLTYGDQSKVKFEDSTRPELREMNKCLSIFQAVYRAPIKSEDRLLFTNFYPLIVATKVNIETNDHVNLRKVDVDKYYGAKNLVPGKKYYIIAKCLSYKEEKLIQGISPKTQKEKQRNGCRWGLYLGDLPDGFKEPIFLATNDELRRVNAMYPEIFDILERKSGDKFRSPKQKKLRIS